MSNFDMQLVPTSEPIDMSDFGFEPEVSEAIGEALIDRPPRLDFPISWDFGDKSE